ncbi:uncharacterized protein MONOS_2341 [Monocercomonoides exilis]|uniref:uncharacterized protein n=1 Tax=Monocercomonoides exilis TaxID=2049356 RepID=UPI003559D1F4|nr:hypothetical protein MONOS_2341 [Monocercomonoides exilis]|eukprot:MONOS_2341.1-p1 / transcript=MONOS_2341.1 / gene=MONOS_2341 / organism=Monocercomonoides_exilis_PA203 / gene_product=unspecified product / transcript_product=unspecified product / location=Mono_scaffold00048:8175-8774(-) / protein_length=178 / sequence_SO=supercontig / SO=protein_coding / is_pseudo=false
MQETGNTKKFAELFSELEDCNEEEQKQNIGEMNGVIDGMNEEEFNSIFTTELFDEIQTMIEKKKITMENAFYLLKRIGYCKAFKHADVYGFEESSLNFRFEKMIENEDKKKEINNENLLIDLYECYVSLNDEFASTEFLSIIVPRLLKVASIKEESEEVQKKVEMALLALSDIGSYV